MPEPASGGPENPRTIAVVLPYAVSIRDFVGSGLLERLAADRSIRLTIHTLNPELPELEPARAAGVGLGPLQPYSDTRLEKVMKGLYLYVFSDRFVYIEQGLAGRPLRQILAAMLVILREALGTGRFLRLYEKVMLALFRRRALPLQMTETPDMVVGTRSLLNSIDYGIMAEARARSIPIVTLAGSWDNFTTKGFIPFKAEKIVVWNAKMRHELEDIFAVPAEMVEIAGYPRKGTLERLSRGTDAAGYLAELGHADYSRFVLYSASYSELTRCPGDPVPLEYQVMAQVASRLEEVLPPDVCIILRMHPFSDPESNDVFAGLKRSFVFVPGRRDSYVERVMTDRDEADLARQIALSECVVSLASTMSIDSLSLDRPVVNTCFDPRSDVPYAYSNTRIFAFNHFRDITKLVQLPIARTVEETVAFVVQTVTGTPPAQPDREAFEQWYVPTDSHRYNETVARIIHRAVGPGDRADATEKEHSAA